VGAIIWLEGSKLFSEM